MSETVTSEVSAGEKPIHESVVGEPSIESVLAARRAKEEANRKTQEEKHFQRMRYSSPI